MQAENDRQRAPIVYVALAASEGFGRFVVYYGEGGENSVDVYRKAWDILGDTGAKADWVYATRTSLSVLSVTNARRLYRGAVRTYEREHGIASDTAE